MDEVKVVPMGWQCPVCGRVYSPTTIQCFYCGNEHFTTTTGTHVFSDDELWAKAGSGQPITRSDLGID